MTLPPTAPAAAAPTDDTPPRSMTTADAIQAWRDPETSFEALVLAVDTLGIGIDPGEALLHCNACGHWWPIASDGPRREPDVWRCPNRCNAEGIAEASASAPPRAA